MRIPRRCVLYPLDAAVLMRYEKIVEAKFIARPNRFVAEVELNGAREIVHVKNTGRCRELLIPGCRVYLSESDVATRKTKYDLVAVEKRREDGSVLLINMDSQIVNDVADEWLRRGELFSSHAVIRREVTHGASRFDFHVEDGARKAFLEVKGVTLETDGVARFPDAPTERGVKHLRELIDCAENGMEAYVLFVIQMKGISRFGPNDATHALFGRTLREAERKGVKILAYDCVVSPDSVSADSPVPIDLT